MNSSSSLEHFFFGVIYSHFCLNVVEYTYNMISLSPHEEKYARDSTLKTSFAALIP